MKAVIKENNKKFLVRKAVEYKFQNDQKSDEKENQETVDFNLKIYTCGIIWPLIQY